MHSPGALRYVAKMLYEIMLDETVETRRPWRGSPHPCVHAGVFLRLMGIISTVSKPLRYSHLVRVRVHPGARGLRPYVVAG